MKSSELKELAKGRLHGNYSLAIAVVLIHSVILFSSMIFTELLRRDFLNLIVNYIYSTCVALLTGTITSLVTYGCTYFFLNLSRNREFKFSDLFYAFRRNPDTFIIFSLITNAIIIVFSLPVDLIMLPLIYSTTDPYTQLLYIYISILIVSVLTLYFTLGVTFVSFIILDNPDIPALKAVKLGWHIAKGKKLRILYVSLSFLPLFCLSVLTLGIALLWILPYIHTTLSFLYMDTIGELNIQTPEEANQF